MSHRKDFFWTVCTYLLDHPININPWENSRGQSYHISIIIAQDSLNPKNLSQTWSSRSWLGRLWLWVMLPRGEVSRCEMGSDLNLLLNHSQSPTAFTSLIVPSLVSPTRYVQLGSVHLYFQISPLTRSLDDWVALICCYVRSVLFIYFSLIPHICIFLLLKYRWRIMVFLLTWQFIFCGHICFYFKTEHNVFIYIYLNKRENKNHIVCHIVCISEQK